MRVPVYPPGVRADELYQERIALGRRDHQLEGVLRDRTAGRPDGLFESPPHAPEVRESQVGNDDFHASVPLVDAIALSPDGEIAWIYRDHRYATDDGEWFMHGLFA